MSILSKREKNKQRRELPSAQAAHLQETQAVLADVLEERGESWLARLVPHRRALLRALGDALRIYPCAETWELATIVATPAEIELWFIDWCKLEAERQAYIDSFPASWV